MSTCIAVQCPHCHSEQIVMRLDGQCNVAISTIRKLPANTMLDPKSHSF